MKILHTVGFYEPHKGGSEEVVRQISERLAMRGHEVSVATRFDPRRRWKSLNGVRVEGFEVSGNLALGIRGEADRYRRFLLEASPDVVLNYAAQIWSTDLAFDVIGELECAKVIVPCGYSGLKDPQYRSYFSELPRFLREYDALIYMSPNYQDKSFGDEAGLADKAVIIPNGASREEFEAPGPSFRGTYDVRDLLVLTVSNHYEIKGHRRLVDAFKHLGRKDATLAIVGGHAGRPWQGCYPWCQAQGLLSRRILAVGNVERPLVVSAFREADVFVLASEVECAPIVIYEAMAAGVPFVSTDCGNVRDNADFGIVVDDPSDLPEAIAQLLDDPGRRRRLGEAGKHAWRAQYTWDKITDSYEDLYQRLVLSGR